MLSSLNSFGGLSSTELLMLFGAKSASSSSSSSNSTSTSIAQLVSTGVSGASANDPAKVAKAIAAQVEIAKAQIDRALAEISAQGSTFSVTANVAYAAQTAQTSPGSADSTAGETSQGNADSLVVSSSFTTASSASGSVGDLQLAISIGNDTVALGFAMQGGPGQVSLDPTKKVIDVGQGNLADFFQINASANGQGAGIAFNLVGLDAEEAQQAVASFKEAVSGSSETGSASPWGFRDNVEYAPGFSVGYTAQTYQYTEPVVIVQDTLTVTVAG